MSSLLFILIVVTFAVMRQYRGENGAAFPPASTKKGKEARVVVGILLLPLLGTLIYQMVNADEADKSFLLFAAAAGVMVPIIKFIQFKRK